LASSSPQPRIVIVGGGFGGVAAARALRKSDAEVFLIDRRNHHIFQPLLYQVATAVLSPSEVAAPIRQLARKQKNLSVMLAEVTDLDLKSRSVTICSDGIGTRIVPFDYLILAPGVQASYFGHDEFAEYAPSLKTLADGETIRAKILGAYEKAELTEDPAERASARRASQRQQPLNGVVHPPRCRAAAAADTFHEQGAPHIGYGSPHKQDTAAAHGEPLGEEEIRLAKRDYGWPEDAKFLVPDAVRDHFAAGIGTRGPQARGRWTELFTTYRSVIRSSRPRSI
jgi:glycine/D-amino acid oxidase-like deaminating enzyme